MRLLKSTLCQDCTRLTLSFAAVQEAGVDIPEFARRVREALDGVREALDGEESEEE